MNPVLILLFLNGVMPSALRISIKDWPIHCNFDMLNSLTTLDYDQAQLPIVMRDLECQTGGTFYFSMMPEDSAGTITIHCNQLRMMECLNSIFSHSDWWGYRFEEEIYGRDDLSIIIEKRPKPGEKKNLPHHETVSDGFKLYLFVVINTVLL